jgi:hypothetical protein
MSKKSNVGFKQPPVHSQYKKGQSGNPKGRRKGSKNARSVFLEQMARLVPAKRNGKSVQVPAMQAVINKAMQAGFHGNARILLELLKLAIYLSPAEKQGDTSGVSENGEEIIKQFEAKIARRHMRKKGKDNE